MKVSLKFVLSNNVLVVTKPGVVGVNNPIVGELRLNTRGTGEVNAPIPTNDNMTNCYDSSQSSNLDDS